MNKIVFHHKEINNGKEKSFFVPVGKENEDYIKTQISEIFVEKQYQRGLVKKDMVIMDVGANVGLASLFFKDHAKTLYALEPNPKNYECLVENTKEYPHIKNFNTGLVARTGYEELKTEGNYPIAESLFGVGRGTEIVKFYSIDEFMKEQNIEHIDLMKFDTEGAEYIVFPSEAFGKVASKIDHIIGELHYFNRLIPDYIPLILNDYGFKTEFLPITNMELTLSFNEGKVKNWKLPKQTIFFSKRYEKN